MYCLCMYFFFFSSRSRHTRSKRDWSSDVCSSDLLRRCSHHRAGGHIPTVIGTTSRKSWPPCPAEATTSGKLWRIRRRSEEHTSELQSRFDLVCRLLLEKKKKKKPQLRRPNAAINR